MYDIVFGMSVSVGPEEHVVLALLVALCNLIISELVTFSVLFSDLLVSFYPK